MTHYNLSIYFLLLLLTQSLSQTDPTVPSTRPRIIIAKKEPYETIDVSMVNFGHELAFHIIHPEVNGPAPAPNSNSNSPTPLTNSPTPTPTPKMSTTKTNEATTATTATTTTSTTTTTTTEAPLQPRCISWRQTSNCDPTADREPDHDLDCSAVIHSGSSGYCECEGGRKAELSKCVHNSFTCQNICTGTHIPIPLDYKDMQTYFSASALFKEMKPSNVNQFLSAGIPFFLIVLCDCQNDILTTHEKEEDNWPINKFEVQIRESNKGNSFSYVYVLPDAANHFSLYEQYSISKNRPHIIIDNIPNGPMNEKFLSPFKVPGQTAADMMHMVNSFFDYTLPLLIRSNKGGGRGLRGAIASSSSGSHMPIEVTSDTFQEIVLDPTRACFLLIYSPTCPASRSVLPILDDVAKEHHEFENVTIAKIDLTSNDLPVRDIVVQHYPTGYLFPAGLGDVNGHHPEWKNAINFASFKGESTPHDRSKPHSHWSKEVIAHFIEHEVMPDHVLIEAGVEAGVVASSKKLTNEEQYTLSHQNAINQQD